MAVFYTAPAQHCELIRSGRLVVTEKTRPIRTGHYGYGFRPPANSITPDTWPAAIGNMLNQ